MKSLQKGVFNHGHLFFLLAVSLYAARSFFAGGFIPTHDGEYHIMRLWQFDRVFRSGVLLPRWAPDLNSGYGVPIFEFFYPLPNYVGELFHLLGFSLIDSVQLTLIAGLVISSFTFYVWMRCFFGKWQSVTGSIVYLLAPYHLVDVFVRGSVGEVWALAIVPYVLFLIIKIVQNYNNARQKYPAQLSLALALLLTSHNILGVLFFAFSLAYAFFVSYISKKNCYFLFIRWFIIGALITSFFWIPVIFESKYVTGLRIVDVFDHFVALFQLIIPSWGTGFSVPGVSDEMSFQIGIPHLLVISLSAFIGFRRKDRIIWWLFAVLLIVTLLTLEVSKPVWQIFPFLVYFQYPWRILSLVILASSFFAGYVTQFKPIVSIPLVLFLALVFYLPYTNAVVYEKRDDEWYLTNPNWTEGTATLGNTFNTIWFIKPSDTSEHLVELVDGRGSIAVQQTAPTSLLLHSDAETPITATLHQAYFPGWMTTLDGKLLKIEEKEGLIYLAIPAGKHSIIVKFGETPIRAIADSISLATFAYLMYSWYQRNEDRHLHKSA